MNNDQLFSVVFIILVACTIFYVGYTQLLKPEFDIQKEFRSNDCLVDTANSYCFVKGFKKLNEVYVTSYEPKWRFSCLELQEEHEWRDPSSKGFRFTDKELRECDFNG